MKESVGRSGSFLLIGVLGALVATQPTGCDNTTSPADDTADPSLPSVVLVSDVLAMVGDGVILPAVSNFVIALDELEVAVADWGSAIGSGGGGDDSRASAQEKWITAMSAWQQLEVMQVGPAASSLKDVAGQDIRDEIYSWPTTNTCLVDQNTVTEVWKESAFFNDYLVNSYGLDSLEQLLFSGDDNVCPGQVGINTDGTWDALGTNGINVNRAEYAATVIAGIQDQTDALYSSWSSDGDDFGGEIADGGPYGGEQEALDAIFQAIFYLETLTKDQKLAIPMGLQECSEENCPEDVELPTSGASIQAITGNLIGFKAIFIGGDGAGMDDLLVEVGHGDLSDQMIADLDTAIALGEAFDVSLATAVVESPDEVEAFYTAVQSVTSVLKGDLATILVLTIPTEAAGDND